MNGVGFIGRKHWGKVTFLFVFYLTLSSCSKSTFQSYYNQEKEDARIAMAFPKFFAMIAIPDDAREEVKYFTKGMKRIRLLYFENERRPKPDFTAFAEQGAYVPYIVAKQDGSRINVYSKEDEDHIREIVLDVQAEDEGFTVALIGKMDKRTFAKALERAKEDGERF